MENLTTVFPQNSLYRLKLNTHFGKTEHTQCVCRSAWRHPQLLHNPNVCAARVLVKLVPLGPQSWCHCILYEGLMCAEFLSNEVWSAQSRTLLFIFPTAAVSWHVLKGRLAHACPQLIKKLRRIGWFSHLCFVKTQICCAWPMRCGSTTRVLFVYWGRESGSCRQPTTSALQSFHD